MSGAGGEAGERGVGVSDSQTEPGMGMHLRGGGRFSLQAKVGFGGGCVLREGPRCVTARATRAGARIR